MNTAPSARSALARLVVDLCRLRGDPQDLPYAPNLLAQLLVAGIALDTFIGYALDDAGTMFARSLLSTGIVLALCWVALAIRGVRNRYIQTATALLACSLAFSLLQLPIALLAGPSPATVEQLTTAQVLLGWIALALLGWQVSVDAYIMRHAIDASFGLAFALVVSWLIAYWAIDSILLGAG